MVGKLIPDFFPKIFGAQQNLPLDADAVRGRVRGARARDRRRPVAGGRRRRLHQDRGREHGERDQEDLGAARLRRDALRAQLLRRRRRPARLPGRRCARHDQGADPSVLVADVGLRHGACRHPRHAPAGGRGAARRCGAGVDRGDRQAGSAHDARNEVAGQGIPARAVAVHVRAHIRYAGTDTALVVPAFSLAAAGVKPEDTATASLAAMKSAFEAAHKSRFGFIDESKELVVEAVSVEAVGGGAKFAEPTHELTTTALPSPARGTRFYSGGAWHEAAVYTREQLSPGHTVRGPAIIIEPHQTIVVEDGWQAAISAKNHLVLERIVPLDAAKRHRHPGRSGDARGVQQPLHVDRRADGRVAAEHRLFRQHQGAARLLLRGVRRRLDAGRQRAAHAGASRLHGPRGRDHHPREPRQDRAGRRLCHQRTLQRRHAPPRHHGVHAGVRRRPARDPVLGGIARPPCRRRRHLARLDVAERDHDRGGRRLHRQFQDRGPRPLPRAGALRPARPAPNIPPAIRCRTSTT